MDIKQRLRQVVDWSSPEQVIPTEFVVLCRDALAEIEHWQKYAQHYPQCRLVKARLDRAPMDSPPENSLCNCGLVRIV